MMDSAKIRVLLALDASKQSGDMINYMSRLLPPEAAEITMMHVIKGGSQANRDFDHDVEKNLGRRMISEWEEEQRKAAASFLDEKQKLLIQRGFPSGSIQIVIKRREKGVAADIHDEAQKGYDVIAVGRWGRSDVTELVYGSVTHRLMAKATDRTLCVVAGNPTNSNLLLAVDATDSSERAVEFTTRIAGHDKGNIRIFHAVRRLKLPPYVASLPRVEEAEERLIKEEAEFIKPVMQRAMNRLIAAGVDEQRISVKIVKGVESRAESIVKEAREHNFDGIVLGRRQQTREERFFVGRVGDKVFQLARKRAVFMVA